MSERSTTSTGPDRRRKTSIRRDFAADDAPRLTKVWAERAEHRIGDTIIREADPPVRIGRPPKPAEERKQQVTMRLSPDLLAAMRATGQGWQTRAEEVLRHAFLANPTAHPVEGAQLHHWVDDSGNLRAVLASRCPAAGIGEDYGPTLGDWLMVPSAYPLAPSDTRSSGIDLIIGGNDPDVRYVQGKSAKMVMIADLASAAATSSSRTTASIKTGESVTAKAPRKAKLRGLGPGKARSVAASKRA